MKTLLAFTIRATQLILIILMINGNVFAKNVITFWMWLFLVTGLLMFIKPTYQKPLIPRWLSTMLVIVNATLLAGHGFTLLTVLFLGGQFCIWTSNEAGKRLEEHK